MKNKIAYIVPHTHWDREWRYPIWKNRVLLVEFMDELIETLENDEKYSYFHLDGQVVIIEDYLEIRPDKKETICRFVKEGRLGIGPFYTLPDLYPVSGECIVRNIQKGIQVAKKYGGYVNVGYHSFGWGQISQFPQIYNDLGFDFLITAKYVSKDRAPDIEFLWEAPDGSRIITSRLGQHARANFYFNAYIQLKHGIDYASSDFQFIPGLNKSAIHNTEPEKQNTDYFTIEYPDENIYDKFIQNAVRKAWDAYAETTVPDNRLIMNGSDFSSCQPLLPEIIKKANENFNDIDFKHTSLMEYVDEILPKINKNQLKIVKGELRDGSPANCTANALTTRMYLKLLNRKAQNLLIRVAEPMAAILSAEGAQYLTQLFETAWEYLFKSHAHDSINGVTQDKTANDVEYHLNQVIEIAESLIEQSMSYLTLNINTSEYQKDDNLLCCFNSLPQAREDVIKLVIDTPRDKNIWDFVLTDENGATLDVQHIARKERTTTVYQMDSRSWPYYHDRHEVYIETGEIYPCGYKILKIVPQNTFKREAEWWPLISAQKGEEISQAPGTMENEYLYLELSQTNGTVNLTCKTTGKKYNGIHYFVDEGDMGDYWVHYPHYHQKSFDSRNARHNSWISENGALAATLVVETKMELPAFGYRSDKGIVGESKRSRETKILEIISEFTIKKADKKLYIKTTVNNTVEDHRLRLFFPTGINAGYTNADGHFIVENRLVNPRKDESGKFYHGMQTLPMQNFVNVENEAEGFAIVTNSIGEYEMLRDHEHTLALTLFRSVENRICSEYRASGYFPEQKGGQCLRKMEFEYAVLPHKGNWNNEKIQKHTAEFNVKPVIYQFFPTNNGKMPAKQCLFSLSPSDLVVSALKKSENGDEIILRVYNPTGKILEGTFSFSRKINNICLTNLTEEKKDVISFSENSFQYTFKQGKILTFGVSLAKALF